jgi:hypothetical protein
VEKPSARSESAQPPAEFKETKSTIRILSAAPDHVEDELAAERELSLQPKPKLMSEDDPRHGATLSKQQRADALNDAFTRRTRSMAGCTPILTNPKTPGASPNCSARPAMRWRKMAPTHSSPRWACSSGAKPSTATASTVRRCLLVPVELKRKSVLEGFSLRRIDEETRLNVTLMEMLRQNFHKEVPGLDPLPEDETGADVARVFQLFRDAVRDLPGWEVKTEIWLGQFSFTKFLLWKDLADRLDDLTRNRIVNHLVNAAGAQYRQSARRHQAAVSSMTSFIPA